MTDSCFHYIILSGQCSEVAVMGLLPRSEKSYLKEFIKQARQGHTLVNILNYNNIKFLNFCENTINRNMQNIVLQLKVQFFKVPLFDLCLESPVSQYRQIHHLHCKEQAFQINRSKQGTCHNHKLQQFNQQSHTRTSPMSLPKYS